MADRKAPVSRAARVDTVGMDEEMKEIFKEAGVLPKLAPPPPPPKMSKAAMADSAMAQWARVDKARAIKGLPSLPKPGKQK